MCNVTERVMAVQGQFTVIQESKASTVVDFGTDGKRVATSVSDQ